MRVWVAVFVAFLVSVGTQVSRAEIFPRAGVAAGSVISRKSGEEIRFIDVSAWRGVDVSQDLLAGDVLRTNAIGHLAILFSDRTQLRLGRNTTLLVKHIGESSDSVFGLQTGSIWGRAETGGLGLTVETPAAAAAIRGTDFSLNVEGDKTSLIVLDGEVELANEFGSVSVSGGEAAVARIGQAPTKIVIVDPDDREQMLFYLTLRGAFTFLPATPSDAAAMRRQHRLIAALPPESRSVEDWVSLAETTLSVAGRPAAAETLDKARAMPLSRRQRARLDLVEALILGSGRRYAEAAALFQRALPGLDPARRAVAAYGGYFARALADPDRLEDPPAETAGPYGALADAYAAGFLRDIRGAIDALKRAEQRYPGDPTLPAARAQFALLMDDRDQVKEAIDRALAIDPENPTALEARAGYRAGIESDLKGALEDLGKAVLVAPGSSSVWNALGLVLSQRGAMREAEEAFKRAIELDPEGPVARANLAIHYLDQGRLREAKAEIDRAIAADPSFSVALVARGRYYLQTGEMEKAQADLLAGTTAHPAHAQGLLLLGSGHYESGDRDPAAQALRNADRLDPNDPVTSSFAAAIALDDYDADTAIESAQETVRRSRARGGAYAPLSANREAGSLLNSAFRLQELNAWGRFYGDVIFDPFAGATFADQAVSGSPDPFSADINPGTQLVDPGINKQGFSSLFQGLMVSPEMLSGRSRSANLFRRPFLEASAEGGFVSSATGRGWTGSGEVQSYAANPFPWSLYLKGDYRRTAEFRERFALGTTVPYVGFDLGYESIGGVGYLTASPTPDDRFVLYAEAGRPRSQLLNTVILINDPMLPFGALTYDRRVDMWGGRGGVGWSHSFGYRNNVNAAFLVSDLAQTSNEQGILLNPGLAPIGTQVTDIAVNQRSYLGALNHTVSTDELTWRYGVEAGTLSDMRMDMTTISIPAIPVLDTTTSGRNFALLFGRAYVDAIWDIAPDFKAEAALFGTRFDGSFATQRLEPRLGLAWSPVAGHWLSAGFIRETNGISDTTLAPIGVVGLQANQAPLDIGGMAETFAARWNAEWGSRFFTSLDYQHQNLQGLSIGIPGGLTTIDLASGQLDRVSATANLRLGHGVGLFGTVAFADSRNLDPASAGFGGALPFVPSTAARVGASWVHPANIKFTAAATYVGSRTGTEAGDIILPDYWTADAFLTWEPFDKRFKLELAAYNLFDTSFDVGPSTPGWGRTFTGSLKGRF
ncbi:MAG: FecR domain-containing protein [Rhizobiaceae bacterium]|nr:FecR domain-containing protein [Rhizobiaceae bacterium]MCV0407983.1 FecR domain-containing protein [Rhizobiaceae bacterium]